MRTFSHPILLILFLTLAVFSQEPIPSARPTATPDDNDVVRISTNLIQIDVTVTDKNGKPITDLKSDEVEIYENSKLQKVTNFSFVNNQQTKLLKDDRKPSKGQVLLPPPPVRPESVRRTIALVVDDLTLSFGETAAARDALRHFVNEQMQDGDLVAILRTGSGIGALQQFTTDKRMLLAAVDKVKFNMSGSVRLGTFNAIAPTLNDELNGTRNQQGKTRNRGADIATERDLRERG